MKQIISCSRKTDIPAFYYDWLQDALKNQQVVTNNPLYPEKEYIIDLAPESVHTLILWSKDFFNVLHNPGYLDKYNLYFEYTITGYGRILEPNVPEYEESIMILQELLTKYKSKQFNIRFDPVMITSEHTVNERLSMFERLCKDLSKIKCNDARITTSYLTSYGKVEKRLSKHGIVHQVFSEKDQIDLFTKIGDIAKQYGFSVYACCNPLLNKIDNIQQASCIDGNLLEELFGERVTKSKDTGQRKACGCAKSKDIGNYQFLCNHNCLYCYANPNI